MDRRNHAGRHLLFLFAFLMSAGCGSEGSLSDTIPLRHPEGAASCETLEPLLFQDPRTGGAFHCLWCSREWKWTVPAGRSSLFILIEVTCERVGSEAYVEIRNPATSVVWRREIREGDGDTQCIHYADAPTGTYSVRLYGRRAFLGVRDLIEEFDGSLYLKLFNERGEWLPHLSG